MKKHNIQHPQTGIREHNRNNQLSGCKATLPKRSFSQRYGILLIVGLIGFALLAVVLAGCDSNETREIDLSERIDDSELIGIKPERDDNVLYFGFDLRGSPDEDARQYIPFLKYLEEATGLHFELRFTAKNGAIVDDLGKGKIQFAAIGADTYIQAHAKYGVIPLVRGLNEEGRAEYQSVIIVAPGSPIRKIEELRGKRFAFGSITSTQGHLIPRIILAEHGILLEDLAGYEHTGSHQNCAKAVATGHFEAGGMQDLLGKRLVEDELIRIIYTSEFYPSSGIAANSDIPSDVIETVKQALIDFKPKGKDAEGLYHWDRTEMVSGFSEAREEDYAKLRRWSIKLGLLDTSAREEAL